MLKKFISYYGKYKKLFFFDLLFAFLVALIDLVFPLATRKMMFILDGDRSSYYLIFYISIGLLVLYIIRLLMQYFIAYYGHYLGVLIEKDMRMDLFKKYETLDYEYFNKNKTGKLMSNITNHLRDVSEMAHHAPEDLFLSFIMLVGSFVILLNINVYLTLVIMLVVIAQLIFTLNRRKKQKNAFRNVKLYHGELNAKVESSLSGIRLTKAFTNEEYECQKFEKINDDYASSYRKAHKQMAIFQSGNEFFIELLNLTIYAFGAFLILLNKDLLVLIDLTTYFLFVNFLTKPINRLINSMQQIQEGLVGVEIFYNILKINPQITSPKDGVKNSNVRGDIVFEDVSFNYEEDLDVLKNFNLKVPSGKRIGLVGYSGVGKSTISKLLMRFYDVNSGKILIDDINVKDYDLSYLRSTIGYLQQDVFLFYGSVYDNVRYGKIDASDEEVIAACKKAKIHDFVMSLKDGYDSIIGERGVNLSGGQMQRISIARLFLKNPQIIILDEATSALDSITEVAIQESFDELSKGKTTIVIAHRLSTIKDLDEIIVLDGNGICERGKHDDLIKQNGYYAALWHKTKSNLTV